MIKKLNKLNDKNICKILFIFSFIFLTILGFILTYNFDFTNHLDLLFESDTGRVIRDMTDMYGNHYRLKVHPLFVILTEPIFFILRGFTINNMIALIIMSSLTTSLTIVFIYKILSLYSDNIKIKIIITLCYLFSFSNIIYTAGIEIYNYAALFLVILWYYVLKRYKEDNFNSSSFFILIVLGILSLSFTITNIVVFGIVLFILLIFKKYNLKDLILIGIFTLLISLNVIYFQNIIWHNTPTIGRNNYSEETNYTNLDISFSNINNVIKGDYTNSILSNNIYPKSAYSNTKYVLDFNNSNIFNIIIMSIFYILFIILIIRNFKYNKFANTGLLLTLLFNTCLHTIYGNTNTFLYSLHFTYLIFILFGINLLNEKNDKLKKYSSLYLLLLLLVEFIFNNVMFLKVVNIVSKLLESNYYVKVFGLFKASILAIILILFISLIIYFIIKLIKKLKTINDKDKKIVNIIIITLLILFIQCIFITLETSIKHKTLLLFPIKDNNTNIDSSVFEEKYIDETNEFKQYLNEYSDLLNNYKHTEIDYLNNNNYFFFGLGNRRKLLFKDNKLIDLDTKYNIYSFDSTSTLVIPNLYTILIKTSDNKYIKIKEDNNGVHYITDDKDEIIKGTDTYIELYNFDNQKYQNIKKVLYNEILFNIKDSKIYPNILVYNKPWYRDAALAAMVLKQTNNIDLISDWVKNITEVYDQQNKGNKETDNLGELLYLISTGKNINTKLVKKIEDEANRIVKNSKNNYLIGTTDFKERPLYQNLWYKFGIESVGKKYNFTLPIQIDDYSYTAWWSKNIKDSSYVIKMSDSYPYLLYANYHTTKKGNIPFNNYIYPLSWEKDASEANYDNMSILGDYYKDNKISPLHTWSASELLLLLLDDTNNLKDL